MSSADARGRTGAVAALRGLVVGALLLVAGLAAAAPAQADEIYPRPSGTTMAIRGHGWGHGIGMSQYGALGGARAGATWQQILAHYYPGTATTAIGNPTMRVRVASLGTTVQALAAPGLSISWDLSTSRALPTTSWGIAITRWRLRPAAKVAGTPTPFLLEFQVAGRTTWTTLETGSVPLQGAFVNPTSGTVTTVRSTTEVVYRGQLRATLIGAAGAESLVPVVALPMDSYLRSVVPNESPASWPAAALSAQAVAARSFAEYHRRYAPASSAWYDVYDDTRSQVFPGTSVGGTAKEYASSTAALQATAGVALSYSGRIAFTQFSSSSGGWTAQGSQPYLQPVRDDWDAVADNPNHTWQVSVPLASIESAYPSIGRFSLLRVTSRNGLGDLGGRVLSLVVEGTSGSVTTTGAGFRSALGLKSDWFAPLETGSAPSFPRDVTSDGSADVLGLTADGNLRVYRGNGTGGWTTPPIDAGSGWADYAKVAPAGTWDADAVNDLVVQDGSGRLYLRRGLGDGTFGAPAQIGTGWTVIDLILPVGDFDGDGYSDLIGRRSSGELYLYRGDGRGGFSYPSSVRIGTGWGSFTALVSPGDFDGDGNPDLLARTTTGVLYLYPGNGTGYWKPRRQVGTGWQGFTALVSPGDFTGDGHADVLARRSDGTLWLYRGNGRGGWISPYPQVGHGWNIFTAIL